MILLVPSLIYTDLPSFFSIDDNWLLHFLDVHTGGNDLCGYVSGIHPSHTSILLSASIKNKNEKSHSYSRSICVIYKNSKNTTACQPTNKSNYHQRSMCYTSLLLTHALEMKLAFWRLDWNVTLFFTCTRGWTMLSTMMYIICSQIVLGMSE